MIHYTADGTYEYRDGSKYKHAYWNDEGEIFVVEADAPSTVDNSDDSSQLTG